MERAVVCVLARTIPKPPHPPVLPATNGAVAAPRHMAGRSPPRGKSPAAHKGMTHAAKAMARCGELLFSDPALLARTRTQHAERLSATPYVCRLPDDVRPPVGEGAGKMTLALEPQPEAVASLLQANTPPY